MEIRMNKTLITILLLLAIVVLAGGIFFAGTMYARSNMMPGWGVNSNGFGMMNGNGGMTFAPSASAGVNMMGGSGGMMNRFGSQSANVTPLTVDQAKTATEKYIQSLDVSGLEIGEIMIFDNNAYVAVKETENRLGAFELLVDPASQIAYPEHGPNMMWNLKYSGLNHQFMMGNGSGIMGMMSSSGGMANMMEGWNSTTPAEISGEMTVTPEQAVEYAQKYLNANLSGATAAENPIQFYGYYTLDFEKDGSVAGMLSVNGYSGQVFLHTWHGTFIEETE
jgi:hypothetical protein